MKRRAKAIGIAGPSCSGKTTVAHHLAGSLDGRAHVLSLDAYYHDRSGIPEHDINVDVPEAIESELLIAQLRELITGNPIEQPVYDYKTHSRAPRGVRVEPTEHIIVEGLFVLYWEELRALLNLSVFIDTDHDTCLARRIHRDTRERGRTRESVIQTYEEKVRPMYDAHVHPTRGYAGLLLNGNDPAPEMAARIASQMSR